MSTSSVRIVEAVLSAAVWLMKLNRLSSAESHDDESGGGGSCSPMTNGCLYRSNQQVRRGCTLTGLYVV